MRVKLILSTIFIYSNAIMNESPFKASPTFAGCPKTILLMPGFEFKKFSGIWYETYKYTSQYERSKCISMNITTSDKAKPSKITISFTHKISGKKKFSEFEQNATMTNISSIWSFHNNDTLSTEANGFIHILDTNYVNYAVALACGIVDKKKEGVMVWILSRTPTIDPQFGNLSLDALRNNKLSTKLVQSDRRNCSAPAKGQ